MNCAVKKANRPFGHYANSVVRIGWLLFLRDFMYRYRQTFLGYFWAFIKPLLMGVPIILVGRQFDLGDNNAEVPYEVYSFIGLIFYNIFWDSVIFPQWIMRRTRKVIQNAPFPHEAVLVSSIFYVLFNTVVYLFLMTIVIVLFKTPVALSVFFTLMSIPLMMLAGISIGIYFAPTVLVYLDVRYSLSFISNILMWSAPIVYKQPETGLLSNINRWNPITYLISLPRDLLFGTQNGHIMFFVISLLFFFVLLAVGLNYFYRAMSIAIDQII
ncbi:ABC transporter permease [bacterium]|nr:ABC transporter permease [bacterium]